MEKEIPFGDAGVRNEKPAVSDAYRQQCAAPGNKPQSLWKVLSEAKRGTTRDEIASLTRRFIRW